MIRRSTWAMILGCIAASGAMACDGFTAKSYRQSTSQSPRYVYVTHGDSLFPRALEAAIDACNDFPIRLDLSGRDALDLYGRCSRVEFVTHMRDALPSRYRPNFAPSVQTIANALGSLDLDVSNDAFGELEPLTAALGTATSRRLELDLATGQSGYALEGYRPWLYRCAFDPTVEVGLDLQGGSTQEAQYVIDDIEIGYVAGTSSRPALELEFVTNGPAKLGEVFILPPTGSAQDMCGMVYTTLDDAIAFSGGYGLMAWAFRNAFIEQSPSGVYDLHLVKPRLRVQFTTVLGDRSDHDLETSVLLTADALENGRPFTNSRGDVLANPWLSQTLRPGGAAFVQMLDQMAVALGGEFVKLEPAVEQFFDIQIPFGYKLCYVTRSRAGAPRSIGVDTSNSCGP